MRRARENPRWGFQRIVGEACKIGVQVSASSVRSILCRYGLGPAPTRSRKGPSWVEFLKAQAAGTVAIDVFHVDTVTLEQGVCPVSDRGCECSYLGRNDGHIRDTKSPATPEPEIPQAKCVATCRPPHAHVLATPSDRSCRAFTSW